MKIAKKIIALLVTVCLVLCLAGCGKTDFDNFKPVGVYIVDCINGDQYEYDLNDKETATEMWKVFSDLEIYEDSTAQKGEAFLLMKFYDKDLSTVIFTIYENGSCLFNRDYETLYKAENGRAAYADLCKIYESYDPSQE